MSELLGASVFTGIWLAESIVVVVSTGITAPVLSPLHGSSAVGTVLEGE